MTLIIHQLIVPHDMNSSENFDIIFIRRKLGIEPTLLYFQATDSSYPSYQQPIFDNDSKISKQPKT